MPAAPHCGTTGPHLHGRGWTSFSPHRDATTAGLVEGLHRDHPTHSTHTNDSATPSRRLEGPTAWNTLAITPNRGPGDLGTASSEASPATLCPTCSNRERGPEGAHPRAGGSRSTLLGRKPYRRKRPSPLQQQPLLPVSPGHPDLQHPCAPQPPGACQPPNCSSRAGAHQRGAQQDGDSSCQGPAFTAGQLSLRHHT